MKRAEGGNRPDETAGHHIPNGGAASRGVPRIGISPWPGRPELGGRRALSLDSLLDDGWDWPEPEPDSRRAVDWTLLALSLGLSSIETSALVLVWGRGVPARRLHITLGITQRKAWKVYSAVRSKLGIVDQHLVAGCLCLEPVFNSRRLAYIDRLASGARVPSLASPDHIFQEIMHEEKFGGLISQRGPSEFQTSTRPRVRLGVNMEDLRKQLDGERVRATRIAEKIHDARLVLEGVDAEIAALNRAADEEQIAAALEERAPNVAAVTKKLATLEGARREKVSHLTGAERAAQRQAVLVEEIEAQIAAKGYVAFLSATLEVRKKIRSTIDDLAAAMLEYSKACDEAGPAACGHQRGQDPLFPFDPHSYEGSTYRSAARQVAFAAMNLNHNLWDREYALKTETAAA